MHFGPGRPDLLTAFGEVIAQPGGHLPGFGRYSWFALLWAEPVHTAETSNPFPDLLVRLTSEAADPSREVRRTKAVLVRREDEIGYGP